MSLLNELKRRNVLRVGAAYVVGSWLLIQVAETIFPLFGFDDTPARIVVIVLAIGFIPALIFAWVFEFTPDGLKLEVETKYNQPATRPSSKKLDRIIIAVLTLALTWFAFDEFVIESQPEASIETSIAVLPFSNRSAVANDVFFVDGIHDDILTQLANLSGLEKVISRTSVGQYRDTDKSMQQIGKELGVANILEGGVQRAENRIRINMQLIDTATDKHLWAETYDREMTVENLFAIQSEIAREIVSALNAVLSDQDDTKLTRLPTNSLEAYGEFVLGRQEMSKRTVEDLDKAIVHFNKAIELDPDYVLPYVNLASSIQIKAWFSRQEWPEVFEQIQSLLDKALSLDPLSGEAWAAMGLLRKQQKNMEEAEKFFLRAIELSPNYASAYQWYSQVLLLDESRQNLGLQFIRKAIELNPLADILTINLAGALNNMGKFDEAIDALIQGHAQNPDFILYYQEMGKSLLGVGKIAEALRWSLEGVRRAPLSETHRMNACWALLDLATDQLTEKCILKFNEDFPELGYLFLSDFYRQSGNFDESLAITLEHQPGPTDQWHNLILAWAYLDAGKVQKAMEAASNISADYFGDDPVTVSSRELSRALQAVYLLQANGQMGRADELARAMLKTMKAMYRIGIDGYGFMDVWTYAALGDRVSALTALRESIDSGWRGHWRYLRLPYTDFMREEPQWNAMIAELEADMISQWEWFLERRDDPLQ